MIPRRRFIKTLGGAGAACLLPTACSDENTGVTADVMDDQVPPVDPSRPLGPLPNNGLPLDFDFPTATLAPFAHGVASGDPLADRVILWTRITEAVPSAERIPVRWIVARDPALTEVVARGVQGCTAVHDWTVKVDATGLQPATTYYYAFEALGARSLIGRTRTAPAEAATRLRLATVACSSYWSSHWSGYGHIADRNDLDLVLHAGDYLYDFVDEDEEVRARKDRFTTADIDYRSWRNLDEVRRRYALWRSDPNLCRAHQQHPWFIVWDNHDIEPRYSNELPTPFDGEPFDTTLDDTCRAFWEWTPSRPVRADGSGQFLLFENGEYPEPEDVRRVYRALPYGPLAEVLGVDTQIGLPRYGLTLDNRHLDGAPTLYGREQFEWLSARLLAAESGGVTWKLINNQTWMAPADVPEIVEGVSLTQLGISRWTGYPAERAALFDYLGGNNPDNRRIRGTVLLSGDAHGNFASDLISSNALLSGYVSGLPLPSLRSGSTPENLLAGYHRATTGNLGPLNLRAASVGVEFAGSSMGRGGADEIIANLRPENPQALNVLAARALELALITGNKNVQFIEWVDHGYGLVDLTPERAIFECWWQDKLTPGSPQVLGMQLVSWAADEPLALPAPRYRDQIDAVTLHGMTVTPTVGDRQDAPAPAGVLQAA